MFHALYAWLYTAEGPFSFLRLFHYLSSRAIFAVITTFFLTIVMGRPFIRYLYRIGMRDAAPRSFLAETSQNSKAGTPTMGGLLIIFATLLDVLLWCDLTNRYVLLLLFSSVWFSGLGIVDDYLKIRHRDSDKGLSRGKKYLFQIAFGLLFGALFLHPHTSPLPRDVVTKLYVPFYKYDVLDLSWAYMVFIVLMIVYAANAINFADGIDGLAIVPSSYVIVVYGAFAYVLGNIRYSQYLMFTYLPGSGEIVIFCAALLGACVGFLWYNSYPAEVFMGDTGSLFLGGVIGTMTILLKQELLFFLVGGIFLAEILSVILQDWIGIQKIGRRFIYRAPIHHCFQYQGLAETKIAVRFWIVGGILALIGLASLKVR